MKTLVLIVAFLVGIGGLLAAESFTDRPLFRRVGAWSQAPSAIGQSYRSAPATILVFRAGGEYIEHHCWIIEKPDLSVIISPGDPHVVVVGRWQQEGTVVRATRMRVARTVEPVGGHDPLCAVRQLVFSVRGGSVTGNADDGESGTYIPMRLDSADFEAYVNEAKRSPVSCGGA